MREWLFLIIHPFGPFSQRDFHSKRLSPPKVLYLPRVRQKSENLKQHKCEQCNKAFGRPDTLKKHIKAVHEKIKDKQCPNCEYVTSYRNNLAAHIKEIHDKIKDFHFQVSNLCNSNNHF